MANKIKLGILGGGEDSLIGVLHRVASSMHDKYELVGGVFNPKHSISLDFGKKLGLDSNRVYSDLDSFVKGESKLDKKDRIEVVSFTGGHLGASLGVVELSVALHYIFNLSLIHI